MIDLFKQDRNQTEFIKDTEPQWRDLTVLLFFFIVFAGGTFLLARWVAPHEGWPFYSPILIGGYGAIWLFRKFIRRW